MTDPRDGTVVGGTSVPLQHADLSGVGPFGAIGSRRSAL
jgi:hypothetical protein